MRLSEHFPLSELTYSATADRLGIKNDPDVGHIQNLQNLVDEVMQPTRDKFGRCRVTSGYRSILLNAELKGSEYSSHLVGQACDFIPLDADIEDVYYWMKENLEYDQLILETRVNDDESKTRWIHVSFRKNRMESWEMSV
jgi:hypothetical protein